MEPGLFLLLGPGMDSVMGRSSSWFSTCATGREGGTAALRGWSGITTAVWAARLPLLLVAGLFL